MKKDWDTQEHGAALHEYLTDTSASRTPTGATGALGYREAEWRAYADG